MSTRSLVDLGILRVGLGVVAEEAEVGRILSPVCPDILLFKAYAISIS